MSMKTMPVLLFNLGGEMLYILDQRLQAQNISVDKCKKVLNDIIKTMLSDTFIEELFKPQLLYPKNAVRQVFDKLAHSSIMKLNPTSMDKLFDLMTMAVKYQVSLCQRPQEVLFVTLNHLDALVKYADNDKKLHEQTVTVFKKFVSVYSKLTPGQFQLLRCTLLSYFQDQHVRVSIFLKDGLQNERGRFILPLSGTVPVGIEVPGFIKMFKNGEPVSNTEFKCTGKYQAFSRIPSLESEGYRGTILGNNIYCTSGTNSSEAIPQNNKTQRVSSEDSIAQNELSLLASLLGTSHKKPPPSSSISLDLFSDRFFDMEIAKEASSAPIHQEGSFIKIDVRRGDSQLLSKITSDFSNMDIRSKGSSSKGDELLSLMDTLED